MNSTTLARSGKVAPLAALVLLAVTGLAAGYYLGPRRDAPHSPADQKANAPQSQPQRPQAAGGRSHRFLLSELDLHDQHQTPQLAADGQTIYALWDSRTSEHENTVLLARSEDGGVTFQSPQVVARVAVQQWDVLIRGKPAKRHSRVWPRIACNATAVYLSWLAPAEDDPSQLVLQVCSSSDGGTTFTNPLALSTDAGQRPGFTGLAIDDAGRVSASWLDGRGGSQQPFAALLADHQLEERLVYAGPAEQGICPCCPTATLLDESGRQLVAFRNHIDGYRDIWLAIRPAGAERFDPPKSIAGERWTFDGCPHDGPSMVLSDGRLHIVWMDGHSGSERVYHAAADVGRWEFTVQPISPEAPGAQGHPAIDVSHDGVLHVVWDEGFSAEPTEHFPRGDNQVEAIGGGRAVMTASSNDGGETFSSPRTLQPRPGVFQLRPNLVQSADGALVAAWCELAEPGKAVVIERFEPDGG